MRSSGQLVRKHQEADVVQKGCEFQIVQLSFYQADRLSDQQGDRSCASTMTGLPRECAINLLTDLTDQNAFDVTA
jgi:hypothetical protein